MYNRCVSKKYINEYKVGERLDKVLSTAFPDYSRSSLAKLIEDEFVTVNGTTKPVRYKLKKDDVLQVDFEPLQKEAPEKIGRAHV